MAVWIKRICGSCSAAPCECNWSGYGCTPTCGCDSGTDDVTGLFPYDTDITIDLVGGQCYPLGGGGCTNYGSRVKVWANSSLIFDSGCVTGDHSYAVTIPGGTTSLRCYAECECDITCESGCGTSSSVDFYC